MTPKEKALDLVATYSRILPMNQTTLLDHKNCALAAVDELISSNIISPTHINTSWAYWKKVKQELDKL